MRKYSDENYVNEIFQKLYPIGSIYISTVSTNPNSLFGFGTWERIQDRFLLAAGSSYSAGSTGGSSTHILTIDEMPSHMHNVTNQEGLGDKGLCATNSAEGTNGYNWSFADTSNDETNNRSGLFKAAATGGSQPHNNMPPYLVVYIWKRVS